MEKIPIELLTIIASYTLRLRLGSMKSLALVNKQFCGIAREIWPGILREGLCGTLPYYELIFQRILSNAMDADIPSIINGDIISIYHPHIKFDIAIGTTGDFAYSSMMTTFLGRTVICMKITIIGKRTVLCTGPSHWHAVGGTELLGIVQVVFPELKFF